MENKKFKKKSVLVFLRKLEIVALKRNLIVEVFLFLKLILSQCSCTTLNSGHVSHLKLLGLIKGICYQIWCDVVTVGLVHILIKYVMQMWFNFIFHQKMYRFFLCIFYSCWFVIIVIFFKCFWDHHPLKAWLWQDARNYGWELSEKVDFNWKKLLQKKVVQDILLCLIM